MKSDKLIFEFIGKENMKEQSRKFRKSIAMSMDLQYQIAKYTIKLWLSAVTQNLKQIYRSIIFDSYIFTFHPPPFRELQGMGMDILRKWQVHCRDNWALKDAQDFSDRGPSMNIFQEEFPDYPYKYQFPSSRLLQHSVLLLISLNI